MESTPTPQTPTNSQSETAQSSSEVLSQFSHEPQGQAQYLESPLESVPPSPSPIRPTKSLGEMSDDELSQWHARMRELQTPQTLLSELRAEKSSRAKKDDENVAPPETFNADEYA